eukprot:scaffold71674_cov19-Phaeocystis_antarctica.AAC.1
MTSSKKSVSKPLVKCFCHDSRSALLPYVLTPLRPYGKARANMVAAGVLPAVRATLTSRRLAADVEVVAAMCGLCQVLLRLGLGLAPSPTRPRPH